MTRIFRSIVLSFLLLLSFCGFAMSQDKTAPRVAVSIKPLHSLVAGVMAGVAEPELVISSNVSPHGFSLKPSDATLLSEADVVFWVGPELESVLQAPIETLAENAVSVPVLNAPGLQLLHYRDPHDHGDDEGHKTHDDHSNHTTDDEHSDHGNHYGHDHQGHELIDPHVWLDPLNAKLIVRHIAEELAELNPENRLAYVRNREIVTNWLDTLHGEISGLLDPVSSRPFVVFHDGYQYFETRYQLNNLGSLRLQPETSPGAKHVREMQVLVREKKVACVFTEPQFDNRLAYTVIEGSDAKTAIVDPVGSMNAPGLNLYFEMMQGLARAFVQCLSTK